MPNRSPTILVIDSDPRRRAETCSLVRQTGHDSIVEADSVEQALELMDQRAEEPGSATVDIILLEGDNAELVLSTAEKTLQSLAAESALILVADQPPPATVAKNAMLDYIARPLSQPALSWRLAAALRHRQQVLTCRRLHEKLAEARHELHRASPKDHLTHIANRAFFEEFLATEWRRCRREKQPITLCLANIDAFKNYNDFYGQLQGDECLLKVATIIAACVKRPADLVARHHGDQFAIVLPETPESGGLGVARRVAKNIAGRNIGHEYSPVSDRLTLSFGVASLVPKAATTVHDLLSLAAQALFEAKHTGRNRIIAAGSKTTGPR